MMSQERHWKLDALARQAGISPRTVRYYVQRGLLPPPVFRGRDTAYSEEHLLRLRAIRRLQERFLPLDAIQRELEQRSLAELQALAEGRAEVAPVSRLSLSESKQMPALSSERRDGEQWQSTDSFNRDDLLILAKVADQAHSWIFAQARDPNPHGSGPTEIPSPNPRPPVAPNPATRNR